MEQILIHKSSGRQTQISHENKKRMKKWGREQVENNGRRQEMKVEQIFNLRTN
jgi:hypothetical protein